MESNAWLTGGVAYAILGVGWLAAAISGYLGAARAAKELGIPNDGCLQGASNVVLAFLGGGVGLAAVPFPWSVAASIVLAAALPTLATWQFSARNRRH